MNKRELVIIPVYNEERTVVPVLKELRQFYKGTILIIDDGSTDKSAAFVSSFSDPDLHVISHESNKGYGASLIDGFQYAAQNDFDIAVTMDCDCQHQPCQVPTFFIEIENYDILSGSRYLSSNDLDVAAPPDRMKINQEITQTIMDITSFTITDAFCGFKAYRVSSLQKMDLEETGYAFPLQLWVQAFVAGLKVKEIPVARIYKENFERTFGGELDNPEIRVNYYMDIIKKEIERCKLTL